MSLWMFVIACQPPPEAPAGLDESTSYMIREFYSDDATYQAGIQGFMQWYEDEGHALVGESATTSNTIDEGSPTTEEEESSSGGLLDASSPIYWMAMLLTLIILGGSVFVMFRLVRKDGQPPPGDTGIGTPDLGIEPPYG